MLVSNAASQEQDTPAMPQFAASLESFLADIGTRAFRFAEAGLRNRDDALAAVQDLPLIHI